MCMGGSRSYNPAPAPTVQLPPPPQMTFTTPAIAQTAPKMARSMNGINYKKKGKRALTIPTQTQMGG